MTQPGIPERIGRLRELAYNLWWSWHPAGRAVFRTMDYPLWRLTGHNPVRMLDDIEPARLREAASDPSFLTLYDASMAALDGSLGSDRSWYRRHHPDALPGPVAYFSMEFALHSSLPIYAGGLGVLAGDLCKEASDMGLPLVAVGFMYPEGYFYQRISEDGWQEETYNELDFTRAPVTPIETVAGDRCLAEVELAGHTLHVGAWVVNLGSVHLYLLDTDLPENDERDRGLSNRLYTAEPDHRLRQEILLGIGGVRVLRSLGITPSVWHANEGHTAFMMPERLREEVEKGASYEDALNKVQAATVFTTHTPVPAGHDVFPDDLVADYFTPYLPSLGLDRAAFLDLGRDPSNPSGFNMTVLAMKTAGRRNAVSRLHGAVTRRMWHGLWPEEKEENVPISYVTNGVHAPTWLAMEIRDLYTHYLGGDWLENIDDPAAWSNINAIPDDELWDTHQVLKRKLFHIIMERAQLRWANEGVSAQQVLSMGALLDHDVLTIGFVRRFAEYKRPALVFHDIERLKRIVNDSYRPVQVVFAGKSHPADTPSKELLRQVHAMARDRAFQGRIAFLEDYDMRLARYLVQGIDVWLNVPRRRQEASGTSGMKACLNGALHLSVPDGWWHEAYDGANGWSVGDDTLFPDPAAEDDADAASLYALLENEVVPLFYDRDRRGVPLGWAAMMKRSVRSIAPAFSARRMLAEYVQQMYLPALRP